MIGARTSKAFLWWDNATYLIYGNVFWEEL